MMDITISMKNFTQFGLHINNQKRKMVGKLPLASKRCGSATMAERSTQIKSTKATTSSADGLAISPTSPTI